MRLSVRQTSMYKLKQGPTLPGITDTIYFSHHSKTVPQSRNLNLWAIEKNKFSHTHCKIPRWMMILNIWGSGPYSVYCRKARWLRTKIANQNYILEHEVCLRHIEPQGAPSTIFGNVTCHVVPWYPMRDVLTCKNVWFPWDIRNIYEIVITAKINVNRKHVKYSKAQNTRCRDGEIRGAGEWGMWCGQ